MNKYLFFFIFLFLIIAQGPAYCQGKDSASLQLPPSVADTVSSNFEEAQTGKRTDHNVATRLNTESLDAVTATLKNPFIPQLPKPEAEPIITEEPEVIEPEPIEAIPEPNEEPATGQAPRQIPKPHLSVSGLVWDTDQPQAIVNNDVVDLGDFVGQWKVINIERSGITVQYRAQTYLIEPQQ